MSAQKIFLLLAVITCFIESVTGIQITYSGGDGGNFVAIVDNYQASNNIAINEHNYISFGPLNINSSRSIYGTGDINAAQTYDGGDATGQSIIQARDATISAFSYANLFPSDLDVQQSVEASGGSSIALLEVNDNEQAAGIIESTESDESHVLQTG